jgi:hypothetical protein
MTTKNRKIIAIEDGVPGCPNIGHLAIHKACDRFLASRGLATGSAFRRAAWLFGRSAKRRAA